MIRKLALMLMLWSFSIDAAEFGMPPTVSDGAQLTELLSTKLFYEGPTWDPKSQKLFFTEFDFKAKTSRILRLDAPGQATPWMDKTEGLNGTLLGNDGRLLGCQGQAKKIVSLAIGPDGPSEIKVLAADPSWNAPNDLCQTARGDIYFTDPDFKNRKSSNVYRVAPDGSVTKVISDMTVPNGIIASPDGKTLYVADSVEKHYRAYPINADGSVGTGKLFCNPEVESKADPDGMTIDEHGTLYFTGRGGIWAVQADGKILGFIPVKEFPTNCTFGGADGKTLFITCQDKVYSLQMKVRGVQSKG